MGGEEMLVSGTEGELMLSAGFGSSNGDAGE